jgi:hypothetical protein
MSETETAGPAVGWSLLLPDTWSRIRLAKDRREQVSALVERAFATVSRDQAVTLRRSLAKELVITADEAFREGGRELYLLTEVRRGMPLAASCVVTVVPQPIPEGVGPEVLSNIFAADQPGSEPAVVEAAGELVPAVRRSEPKRFRSEVPGTGNPVITFTGLDVFVPFPDRSQILLLTFRTPMDQVADPMLLLFEAIAGSLRWRKA